MFGQWLLFLLPLGLFIVVGTLMLMMGRRAPRKPSASKEETYRCGEPVPDVVFTSAGFYRSIVKAFGLARLRDAHTGRLSDYMLWVLAGLAVVVVAFWLL
jgi:hypothetical protein